MAVSVYEKRGKLQNPLFVLDPSFVSAHSPCLDTSMRRPTCGMSASCKSHHYCAFHRVNVE